MYMKKVKYLLIIPVFIIISCNRNKHTFPGDSGARMIYIIDSIAKVDSNQNNSFSPEAKLAELNSSIVKSKDIKNESIYKYRKGNMLLQTGREKDALEIMQQLDKLPAEFKNTYLNQFQSNYALANLRYGERTNCLNNHMAESCIFPIKGMGMHQDESGSRKAISIYQDLLKKEPDNLASRWLLNIAYMTLGGYPVKVPASFLIPGLEIDSSGGNIKALIMTVILISLLQIGI